MSMYMAQHQRKKSKALADSFDEWELFKSYMSRALEAGRITRTEYDKRLAQKAKALDL